MQYVVYSFEAKSIQTYVLASSKLKDRIGASELVESLCGEDLPDNPSLLTQVLEKLSLKEIVQFPRRAGGAFIAVFPNHADSEKQAENLQALWTFTVQKALPALHFSQGIGTGDIVKVAIKNAKRFQRKNQQVQFPLLPLASPFTMVAPRSGLAAVVTDDQEENEPLDHVSDFKRKHEKGKRLINKLGDLGHKELKWPREMPESDGSNKNSSYVFPLLADRSVAIIHADINNLGQSSMCAYGGFTEEKYLEHTEIYTNAIDKIIKKAVSSSVNTVAKHISSSDVMPVRPLVLAGDDITFLVRGDLALSFMRDLLLGLEDESANSKELQELRGIYPDTIPEVLTACAGICYFKASQPMYQAYRLAEDLCKKAKKTSKENDYKEVVPSSVAFHRIKTSMMDSYDLIMERELTLPNNYLLTMNPYFLGKYAKPELAQLSDFEGLIEHLQNLGQTHVRPILQWLYQDEEQANIRLKRWWSNLLDDRGKVGLARELRQCLAEISREVEPVDQNSALTVKELFDKNRQTALADAISLCRFTIEGDG